MELFLMRHADAVSGRGDDFVRELSDKGRKQAEKMGDWLKTIGVLPIHLIASPYPRAVETANIVAARLGEGASLATDERLAPGMTPDVGCAVVHEFGSPERKLMLVGHSPDLGRLACRLLGAKETGIDMKKAAVACFEVTVSGFGGSSLEWLITPKL